MECKLQNLVSLLFVRFALINTTSCFFVATSPIWVYIKKKYCNLATEYKYLAMASVNLLNFYYYVKIFHFFHKCMDHFQGLSNTFLTRMCVFLSSNLEFCSDRRFICKCLRRVQQGRALAPLALARRLALLLLC